MTYYNYRGEPMPESAPETGNIRGTSAGGETVQAPEGHTSVSGEGGGDVLLGTAGDNRFWITDRKDVVVETKGGIDTMIGWTALNAAPGIENLIVHMDFNHAYGNDLNNLIIVDGRQWVYGGKGNDVMVGAANNQTTFVVRAGEGNDVIYNWNSGSQLQLRDYGFNTAAQIKGALVQQGADVVLRFNNGETLTFRDTTVGGFHDAQFLLPLDRSKLGSITFSDEFNSLSLWDPHTETGKWAYDFGGNLKDPWAYSLVSNGEAQVYTSPVFQGAGEKDLGINPFKVENGVLTITAQQIPMEDRTASWGREFSSGMLNTKGMFEQKFGYFEVRAEVNHVAGTWPAFWLVPTPYVAEVEGDVFEALGSTPYVDYRRAYGADESIYDNTLKIDTTGMHTYGMLWTPTEVSFYIDDVLVMKGKTPANWTEPMGMILNMAVGGWGGHPDYSKYPADFKVDWVRAWSLSDGSTTTETGKHETPVFTIRDSGAATSGVQLASVTFSDGAPVSNGKLVFLSGPPQPGEVPMGRAFVVWDDGGKVYGAVSYDGSLAQATLLKNGTIAEFTQTGTWLPDGRVAFGYMVPDGAGQDAWAMVFNTQTRTFVKHQLGDAVGDVRFIPLSDSRVAISWDAPGGKTMARGYDHNAYGDDGWFGLVRQISGDLLGVTGDGKLVAASGSGQQLYQIAGPGPRIDASVSIMPVQQLEKPEGDAGGTLYTYTLIRDWETHYESTVSWRVAPYGGNGAQADDFVGGVLPTGTVTFGIGETTKFIQVWVQGDGQYEQDEMFRVTLFNQINTKLGDPTADGVIKNDDQPSSTLPRVSLATTSLSQAEGNTGLTPFVFTVTRTGDLSVSSTVNWTTAGSGTNPVDAGDMQNATMPSGTLTFAAGESSKTITVNVAADQRAEPDETFTVTLTSGVGASFGTTTATGTVTDDDGTGGGTGKVISLSTGSASVVEGNSGTAPFSYVVTRSGDTSAAASVNWAVTGSGADPVEAADFQGGALPSGTLSFAAGETSKTITFNSVGDTEFEGNETFTLTLSSPTGGSTLGTATATGAINNDDADPYEGKVFTATGSNSTMTGGAGNDTFYASQGYDVITGGGGADRFVFPKEPWAPNTIKDFAVGSDVLDLSGLFQASGYTGTDPVADKYVHFQADGANTLLLYDRDGVGSAQPHPNYIIKLEGVSTAGLTWAKLQGGGSNPGPTQPTIAFSTGALTQAEGNSGLTAFSYTVNRTGDTSGTSTVQWVLGGATANPVNAQDFQNGVLPSGSLTFAAGETSKVITVNITGDTTVEANEGFTLSLYGPTNGTLGTATVSGTVTNDDTAGVAPTVSLSTPSVTLAEGNSGTTAFSYTVTRSGDTAAASSVTWTVAGSGANPASSADFQATTGTVSFAAGETSKVITVNVVGDTTVEQNETFTLTLSNPTGATLGSTVTAAGTITNDDTPTSPPPPPSGGQVYTANGTNWTVTGTSGADTFNASQGYDQITGGAGADKFVFGKEPWAPNTITDFVVGTDRLDFSALFQASGYTGNDPVRDKYVYFQADGVNTLVLFDRDATGSAQQYPNYILKLQGVSTQGLTWAQLSGGASPPPPPPPAAGATMSVTTPSVTLAEGNSGVTAFSYVVTRSGDTTAASSATWTVAGSGANPASSADFQATTGTVSFAAGETSKTVTVNVVGDTTVEQNETFTFTLSNPTGGSLGATVTAAGTITNDDSSGGTPGQVYNSPGTNATITGTAGNDTIHASQGYDRLTGGAGADHFVFAKEPWAPITITDFQAGSDRVDLRQIFDALGYTGNDPFRDGYMRLQSDNAGGTQVLFDRDLAGPNPQWPNYIIHLQNVGPTTLTLSDWIIQ